MVEQERNSSGNNEEPEASRLGMESVGDILRRVQRNRGGKFSGQTSPAQPSQETRAEECECDTCHEKFPGEVTTYYFTSPPAYAYGTGWREDFLSREVRSKECPKCRHAREEEDRRQEEEENEVHRVVIRAKWRKVCGLPSGLKCTRFDDFEPAYYRSPLKLCRDYAKNFNVGTPQGTPSLLMYSSEPGVGKTTLMVCIANYIIENWRGDPHDTTCPIRFESGPGLVRRIRATYNLGPDRDRHEREEDVYAELRGVKLLMLDDVGKEQPQSYRFTQEVYWYIIDERVKAGLPVVVSSKLEMTGPGSLEELMTVDAVDRLFGMCRGQRVNLGGTSYRKRKLIP